tara:strand:- start:5607 stop:5753 length:147 start_codon:yes stop_codon:yes gene_type:complete
MAKEALNQIITAIGIAMYFPKTPEVLMKKVAKSNNARFFIGALVIIFY